MRGKTSKRKLILVLFMGMLVSIFLPTHHVNAESKTIRVGYMDYAGFIEQDEDGNYKGYGVEYLNRVAEYTKWNYQYEKDTWENCLNKLKKGELDLLCSAQYTEERAEYMDYSKYSIGKESTILYTNPDNDDIYYNDYTAMNGKKVALLKESYQTDYFDYYAKSHGFTYVPQYYGSETDMINAVIDGKADLVVAGSLDLHTDLKVVGKFNVQPFYFTTTKGNYSLMNKINTALENIHAASPYYEDELFEKYYGESVAATTPLFTRQEANYIKYADPIVVGLNDDAKPITYLDKKTGGMVGVAEDILQMISEKSGLRFEYKPIHGDHIEVLKTDDCDLLGAVLWTQEMAIDEELKISKEYFTSIFATAALSGNQYSKKAQIQVAMNQSLNYAESHIKSSYPNSVIHYYDTNEECAEAVLRGNADITFQNLYILSNILKKPRYEKLETIPAFFMEEPIAIVGDEDTDPILISIIGKTIEVLDQEEINRIVMNHTIAVGNTLEWDDFLYKYRAAFIFGIVFVPTIIMFGIVLFLCRQRNVEQLKEKNEQLIEAIKQAEHANEAKSLFLSRMSHEIRTPMNAIIGINSLIKKHLKEPKRIESYVGKIALSSTLLLNLINDILDMSAIDKQKLKIAMLPFDLEKVVEATVSMYIPICRNKNIAFHLIYDEEIQSIVVGDQLRVNQIILNLLSNAVKFTPPKGTVNLKVSKISSKEDMELVRIEVVDDGIGIDREQMDRLFEPFEQEDGSTARHFGGSGLGLSITKSLVEIMNGTIRVESEKGKGSTFIVELPFKMAAEDEEPESEAAQRETEMEGYDFTGYRILLADDNQLNQEIALELLENVGAMVDTVGNGREAVERFTESEPGTYDIVLMDVQMPVMDGYEATAQIRHSNHPQSTSIPILAMTANAFTEDVSAALVAGMSAHIAKPIDTDILYKTIELYLHEKEED